MAASLNYITIVQAPTESEPWYSPEQILPGSERLIIKENGREHDVILPKDANYVNIEDVGPFLCGAFLDWNGVKVGGFSITIDGVITVEQM